MNMRFMRSQTSFRVEAEMPDRFHDLLKDLDHAEARSASRR